MAAFTGTPTGSTQYNSTTVALSTYQKALFTYTHAAGAGTGEINLLKLPAGKIIVWSADSRVAAVAQTATADLHLGFRAYVEPDGDAVAEDDNAFADNLDSGAGFASAAWTLPAALYQEFNVRYSTAAAYKGFGLVIYAMIDTANIVDGNTITGWCAYSTV